jgi:hypothetical protein
MRSAIELMTAWNSDPDGTYQAKSHQVTVIVEDYADPVEGLIHLVTGLSNLAGRLLIRLEKVTGEPCESVLQEFALQHQEKPET